MPAAAPEVRLPRFATPFIGRESEISQLADLLRRDDTPLVTLVGPGGSGKTRLAVEVAAQTTFGDGIYFVPLQPLRSADNIVTTMIEALRLQQAGGDPQQYLLDYLREKHLLLVLDNFEHLLDGVNLVTDMLDAAPHVRLLVTSRERLNLQTEQMWPVRGLDVPDTDAVDTLDQHSAVVLFVERARRLRPDFSLENQHDALRRICQSVDGLPLALELAASWVQVMSCEAIADEIQHSMDILETGHRDIPDRHQSMRAVFDHSWHLLSDEEQATFPKLSVFPGTFTAEAARNVAGASLSTLAVLINKSLLRLSDDGRYDLHELVRQYAAEKLDAMPAIKEATHEQHCTYYTEFLYDRQATIHLSHQGEVIKELDNLRAAWLRAVAQRNLTALQRAAASLFWLYHFQAWHDEGALMFYQAEAAVRDVPVTGDSRFLLGAMPLFRSHFSPVRPTQFNYPPVDLDAALAHWEELDERPEMSLPLTRGIFILFGASSDPHQLIAFTQKVLDFARRHHDLSDVATSLTSLSVAHFNMLGDIAQARQYLDEALTIDHQIGFELDSRWVEAVLGEITYLQGNYRETKVHFEKSLAHAYSGGIQRGLYGHLRSLGKIALELDDDATARQYIEESIAVATDQHQRMSIIFGYIELGILHALQGDIHAALACYHEIRLEIQSKDHYGSNATLESFDYLALLLGEYDEALAYSEASLSHARSRGYRVPIMRRHSRVGLALVGLGDEVRAKPYLLEALHEAWAIGTFQVLLEALLGIAQLSDVPSLVAVQLLALVRDHAASNRYSRTMAAQELTTLEASLPPDEFAALVERGRALTPEAAFALVVTLDLDTGTAPPPGNRSLPEPLSPRELEVLALIADGFTNREIADRLVVGVSTVKKHVQHIYAKLDAKNRTSAVAQARERSLLP